MTLRGLAETLFDAIEKEGARAPRLSSEERGTVCRVLRGVVEVEGFTQAASDEVIAFEGGAMGLALDLVPGLAGIVLLHDPQGLRPGDHAASDATRGLGPDGRGTARSSNQSRSATRSTISVRWPPTGSSRWSGRPHRSWSARRSPIRCRPGSKPWTRWSPSARGQRELILGDQADGQDCGGCRHDPKPSRGGYHLGLLCNRPAWRRGSAGDSSPAR